MSDANSSEVRQSGEVTSLELSALGANPFVGLADYNPETQTDENLIKISMKAGRSFASQFEIVGPFVLELKYKRFNVEARKRGVQLSVDGRMMYWHEFFAEYFDVTARHFQQLEKKLRECDKPEDDNDDQPKLKQARPMRLSQVNQLVVCMDVDGGSEYVYAGGGELKRTDTPSANQQDAALKEISEATAALKEKCKAMKAKRWFKVGADSRTLSIGSKRDRRKEAVTV
jgi:hypothetical protein